MKHIVFLFSLVCTTAIVVGCSPIQKFQETQQPTNQSLLAGVGDVVLRIDKSRNLENAYGAADIFGRKTNEGFTEVRFAGLRADGTAVFWRRDVSIQSNETTMSRSGGIFIPSSTTSTTSTHGMIGNTPLSGSSTTTTSGGGTFVPAPKADTHVLPPETFEILVNAAPGSSFVVSGFQLVIDEAKSGGLRYRVLGP